MVDMQLCLTEFYLGWKYLHQINPMQEVKPHNALYMVQMICVRLYHRYPLIGSSNDVLFLPELYLVPLIIIHPRLVLASTRSRCATCSTRRRAQADVPGYEAQCSKRAVEEGILGSRMYRFVYQCILRETYVHTTTPFFLGD